MLLLAVQFTNSVLSLHSIVLIVDTIARALLGHECLDTLRHLAMEFFLPILLTNTTLISVLNKVSMEGGKVSELGERELAESVTSFNPCV